MQQQLERTQQTVASLHALLTASTAPRPISFRTLPGSTALAVGSTVAFDAATAWLDDAYAELHRTLDLAGISPSGPDSGVYHDAFFTEGEGDVVAYVPVDVSLADLGPAVSGRAQALDLAPTRAATMIHEGSFDDIDQTYGALGIAVAELGLDVDGPVREIYLADDRAEVCWPITQGHPSDRS